MWTEPERMYVNKHRAFYCSKSKTIHGGTPVQIIMYINYYKGFVYFNYTYKLLFITLFDYFNLLVKGMFDLQIDKKKEKQKKCLLLLYISGRPSLLKIIGRAPY
jgi:magnesium-transporting ATPase (P-type)